jgi:hypothetical protein
MHERKILIKMLKQLLEETHALQQTGAGYYSCKPVAARYNKLLGQAQSDFPNPDGVINTFESIEAEDPKDPSEKMKVVQWIRIEIGQLISLLESIDDLVPQAQEKPAE